ncbi:MAG: FtsX-like permease family protein [Fimbriimonadaceae bacterium]|nr:FtsX-like permease family protein [Fimbriimonadaceae bacterium]
MTGDKSQFKNVDPPLWVAWHQALASIRVRFFRQLITSSGIALGIAFLVSMQTLRAAESDVAKDQARLQWLIGTSLIMCLVGVTNSMLMSVTERFREIGTIKCLGASDGFIVKVFFIEAALLGLVGSAMGAVLGGLLGFGVNAANGLSVPFLTIVPAMLGGVVLGLLLTVVAAIAPAVQAAKMPAAAALRVDI